MSKVPKQQHEAPPAIPGPTRALDSIAPRSLLAAKIVELALVTYTDERNQKITQLAVVGDNTVHLIEAQMLGMAKYRTPQGVANEWLSSKILSALKGKAERHDD